MTSPQEQESAGRTRGSALLCMTEIHPLQAASIRALPPLVNVRPDQAIVDIFDGGHGFG